MAAPKSPALSGQQLSGQKRQHPELPEDADEQQTKRWMKAVLNETYFRDCEERLTQSQERPDAEILYSFENAADMAAALGISTSVAIKLYNKLNEAKRRRLCTQGDTQGPSQKQASQRSPVPSPVLAKSRAASVGVATAPRAQEERVRRGSAAGVPAAKAQQKGDEAEEEPAAAAEAMQEDGAEEAAPVVPAPRPRGRPRKSAPPGSAGLPPRSRRTSAAATPHVAPDDDNNEGRDNSGGGAPPSAQLPATTGGRSRRASAQAARRLLASLAADDGQSPGGVPEPVPKRRGRRSSAAAQGGEGDSGSDFEAELEREAGAEGKGLAAALAASDPEDEVMEGDDAEDREAAAALVAEGAATGGRGGKRGRRSTASVVDDDEDEEGDEDGAGVDSEEEEKQRVDEAMRDADEVDVKEDPLEGHILPYGPDGQPVPKVQLAYAQGKAMDAFRLILNDCSIEECKQIAKALGWDVREMGEYKGRKRNHDTGLMEDVIKKSTVARWRKTILEKLCKEQILNKADLLHDVLAKLATEPPLQEVFRRYLESSYAIIPDVEEDGDNLPDVLMKLWSVAKEDIAPKSCLLGTKTIYINNDHENKNRGNSSTQASTAPFKKKGNAWMLYRFFKNGKVKLNGSRYKIAEKEEVLQWLLEASRFQQQTKQDQVSVTYKTYKMPAQPKAGDPSAKKGLPGGYWQGYMIKVRVEMTRHEVSPGTDPWQPPAEEGEEAGEQQPQQEEDGGAGPSSQQAAEGGVYVKPEPVDEGAPGPSTGPAGGSQQQDGDMRNGRKVPAHLRGVVSETDDLKPRCDPVALISGLDHIVDALGKSAEGSQLSMKDWLEKMRAMREVIADEAEAMQAADISDAPLGPDGLLTLKQCENLLKFCEGNQYEEPARLERVLSLVRGEELRPYQVEALKAQMLEDQSVGSARHMWVEVPLPEQPKYDPVEVARQAAVDELHRREERMADNDEDGADSDADSENDGLAEKRLTRSQRMEAREQNREHLSRVNDGGYLNEAQEVAREAAKEGVVPVLRCFYCPLLGVMVWNTSLKAMQRNEVLKAKNQKSAPRKVGPRFTVPMQRGLLCALEVGLGKTLVALAASRQPRAPVTHLGKQLDDEWSDDLLNDTVDGYPGHMLRGRTLVIAPLTLLPQWEVEAEKWFGATYAKTRVICVNGLAGKKKPRLPFQLTEPDLVLVTPSMITAPGTAALYKSVIWERIIVDEAHQEPGLLDTITLSLKYRTLTMLTGTPISTQVNELEAVLGALGWPSLSVLASSAHALGYILGRTVVRYTKGGLIRGQKNLELPEVEQDVELVHFPEAELKRYQRLEAMVREQLEVYEETVKQAEEQREREQEARGRGRVGRKIRDNTRFNPMKVTSMMLPLRHACAGGIPVAVPKDPLADVKVNIKREGGAASRTGPRSEMGANYEGSDDDDDEEEMEEDEEMEEYVFQAKLNKLVECVRKERDSDPDRKIVVFSQYNTTLEAVRMKLEPQGFQFRTISSNMSIKKRSEALKAFLQDPPTTIFLLSMSVAALGLTLTVASRMFLMEPCLTPSQEQQAIGRIHRMGQTRPVHVTRLVMHDTIEPRIRRYIERREAFGRSDELNRPANMVKQRGKGTRAAKDGGEDLSGVAAFSSRDELYGLAG